MGVFNDIRNARRAVFKDVYNISKEIIKRAHKDARLLYKPRGKKPFDINKYLENLPNTDGRIETLNELMDTVVLTRMQIVRHALIDNLLLTGIYATEAEKNPIEYNFEKDGVKYSESEFENIIDKL